MQTSNQEEKIDKAVGRPREDHGSKIHVSPYGKIVEEWMAFGLKDHTIAKKLSIKGFDVSPLTVKSFRENFFKKMSVEEVEAVRFSFQEKIRNEERLIKENRISFSDAGILQALDIHIQDVEGRIAELLARSNLFCGLNPPDESNLSKYYVMLKEARESKANNQLYYEKQALMKRIVIQFTETLKRHFGAEHEEKIRAILRDILQQIQSME